MKIETAFNIGQVVRPIGDPMKSLVSSISLTVDCEGNVVEEMYLVDGLWYYYDELEV